MSGAYRPETSIREPRHRAPPSSSAVAAVALALSIALAGCSLTTASLDDDGPADVTGSIAPAPRTAPKLPADLDAEDSRRAMGALALALDPQGNGKTVKWDNPDSGLSGAVVPAGGPFVEANDICRRFNVTVARPKGANTALQGSACKVEAGGWQIRSLSPKRSG